MTYPIQPGPSFPASKSGKLPNTRFLAWERLNTHNPSRVLQHQKQTQYSMLQNKTYF